METIIELFTQLSPLAIGIGAIIGFIINLTGVGGGVIVVPLVMALFPVNIATAIGTASIYTTVTKLYAGFEHWKQGNLDYKIIIIFLAGALPGMLLLGIGINYYLSTAPAESAKMFSDYLEYFVICTIVLAFFLMWKQKKAKTSNSPTTKNNFGLLGTTATFIGGVMGSTGVGGGVLILPALRQYTELSVKKVVGSSIIIALIVSAGTSLIYAKGGQVDLPLGISMILGSFAGVRIGSLIFKKISVEWLEIFIFLVVGLSLVLMILK